MPAALESVNEAEVLAKCEVVRPPVPIGMYWPEIVLLALSFLTPFVAWFGWRNDLILERSASIMLLFAALAEFTTLNRMNRKHLLNACRAKEHQRPWDFSRASRIVGISSLIAGLAGTILWGFGSLIF